jgi:glutathione S-transferase
MSATSLKVYSNPLSGHAHRVRLMLSLLQLPHEVVHVDIKDFKSPHLLAKNPLGQIPILEDGDVTVCDSTAILIYLAMKYDRGTWLPRDPVGASAVQRWLSFASGSLAYGPHEARLAAKFGAPIDHSRAKSIAARVFQVIDAELSSQAFAVGNRPTIADIAGYSYIAIAPEGGISLEPYPNIRSWLARIESLPDFVPMEGAHHQ